MKKIILILGLVFLTAFFLRQNDLYTWPRKGATFDEYAWTWQGMNLIKEKTPISWSPHPHYKDKKLVIYQDTAFYIVKPYLEHPPVFGLVAGSYAILNGANNMYEVDIGNIRGLALILGLFSVGALFLLLHEVYGRRIALLGTVLFATVPSVVVGSRLVQNENFFIPLFLISLFLISRFIKSNKAIYRNAAAIICGLLILAKIPWVAAPLCIVFLLLFFKKRKDVVKFLAIVVPIALLYFAYGFYYDTDLFLSLWGFQLNRYDLYFNSIYALFEKPYLTDRFYTDGWIYFGWFSAFLLFAKDMRKHIFIVFPLISYFLIFLVGIPDEAGHGWYRYPFFPFLISSIAIFLNEYFVKNRVLTFMFLAFIGTSLLHLTWGQVFGFSYLFFRLAIFSWLFVLIPLFSKDKRIIKLSDMISYGWLVLFILMNVWAVTLYNEQ